jgi:hypothetical protein
LILSIFVFFSRYQHWLYREHQAKRMKTRKMNLHRSKNRGIDRRTEMKRIRDSHVSIKNTSANASGGPTAAIGLTSSEAFPSTRDNRRCSSKRVASAYGGEVRPAPGVALLSDGTRSGEYYRCSS